MAGSTFGKNFSITSWGEASGNSIGVVVDGVPAGIELSENDIQAYVNRRKPVAGMSSAKRHENDYVTVNSGIVGGRTTGAPIAMTIMNSAIKDKADADEAVVLRPGLSDFSYGAKYGVTDKKAVSRDSDRDLAARVAGGAVAAAILDKLGISFCSYVRSIGPVSIKYSACSTETLASNPLHMPDASAAAAAEEYLLEVAKNKDSAGGVAEVVVSGLPAGLGEPVFDKLDAKLAYAIMSIGSVKGVEFGDGFEAAASSGSVQNDSFSGTDKVVKTSNHEGGILGGISDGSELVVRAAFRPAPLIGLDQNTVDTEGNPAVFAASELYDTVSVPRNVVVVEAMMAVTILDLLYDNMHSKMDEIVKFYQPK